MEALPPVEFVLSPTMSLLSDLANLLVAGAFMLGLPFAALRVLPFDILRLRGICVIGLGFAYFCGAYRIVLIAIGHHPSEWLYELGIAVNLITAVLCWAFVILILNFVDFQPAHKTSNDPPSSAG